MSSSTYHNVTSATSTGRPPTQYEIDEDELIDLRFNDDATQPYLSLGLTPLSQIDNYSPDDLTDNNERLGFFPSMPPPVSALTSVFSINPAGISVDHNIQSPNGGHMVMPDALPPDTGGSRSRPNSSSRRGKADMSSLSQGYAIKKKLETVPEQSTSLEDGYNNSFRRSHNQHGGLTNGIGGTSSSSGSGDHSNDFEQLIFPSADTSISIASRSLQRQKGLRSKPGTRRYSDLDSNSQDSNSQRQGSGLVVSNIGVKKPGNEDYDHPVKLDRFSSLGSSREEGLYIRSKAREQELIRLKESRMTLEDDRRIRLLQDQRISKSTHDYGSTRVRDPGPVMFANSAFWHGSSISRQPMNFVSTHKGPNPAPSHHDRRRLNTESDSVILKYDQLTTL